MKGNVESLLARAQTNLRSAQVLLDSGDCDSCVSRAYYAMFYAAEAVMLSKGLSFSSHRSLISLFGLHFVRTGIFGPEIGRSLRKLFDDRMASDYSAQPTADERTAELAIGRAREFVRTITAYLKEEGSV